MQGRLYYKNRLFHERENKWVLHDDDSKIDIKHHSMVIRGTVAAIKYGISLIIVILLIIITAEMINSVNNGQFASTFILTIIFLIAATLMNRVIDSYGD